MDTISFSILMIILILFVAFIVFHVTQKKKKNRNIQEKSDLIKSLYEKINGLIKYEQIKDLETEISKLKEQRQAAEKRSNELIKQTREAAEAEIKKNREKAEAEIRESREKAESQLRQIRSEISEQEKAIRLKERELKIKREDILGAATQEGEKIIQTAKQRAEEIAGDAYKALGNAKHYEETVKAMKNIIDGYGDEYLIPNHSVLDDLAEDYSHKEAGVELAKARERTRQMIKNKTAADCDYAEFRRKNTAIHFVLDAFNGKVDTVLAKVRHDNFGKLDREISDAFNLVNKNGEAFRNARIRNTYFQSRQDELRWAVAVNELQLKEREEQKRIKQEMREEELARREYEKAIKEAEKEERLLQQAMEKARKELSAATDEQREEYEAKLRELEGKLKAAEEKNKRAISMAEQTRRGHVYIISNIGSFGEDVFKIGLTRRLEPFDRIRELGDASVPFEFDVHAMIYNEDAPSLETSLHKTFSDMQLNKVNNRKEFFKIGIKNIKEAVNAMGIEAKWTMAAEAREYRETMAIEKAMMEKSSHN